MYLVTWALGEDRDVLRWLWVGALSALGYACGRRCFGWWAHRKLARQLNRTVES